jgi:hypothetical protein
MPFEQFMPRPFTAGAITTYAPARSGVYGISNSREWIFIGETDNIQGSLLIHLREPDASVTKRQPTGFAFEVCDQARRRNRENRLILEYKPVCNPNSGGVETAARRR